MATKDPAFDATALGNLARAYTGVTGENMRRAVAYQQENPGLRLGEALIKLSLLDQRRVNDLVARQAALRRGQATPSDVKVMLDFALRLSKRVQNNIEVMADAYRKTPK